LATKSIRQYMTLQVTIYQIAEIVSFFESAARLRGSMGERMRFKTNGSSTGDAFLRREFQA